MINIQTDTQSFLLFQLHLPPTKQVFTQQDLTQIFHKPSKRLVLCNSEQLFTLQQCVLPNFAFTQRWQGSRRQGPASRKGSHLPELLLQSHQHVKGYICVICISHPTPTTSDTSRLSSCNHFAYRGSLVAPTSVVTANTRPTHRMSR